MPVTAHATAAAIGADRARSARTPSSHRPGASAVRSTSLYLLILTWSFTFFSSARILAYLPTMSAILESGQASQHSPWTWITWFGSNLTMAVWLYEQGGRHVSRAVLVNLCNAAMCGAIVALIVTYRG